jgi:putative hydrolase of the HAD superfamily
MLSSDKHIFFDLDRTLWDFDENSKHALHQIIEHYDLIPLFGSFDRFHRAYVKQNARLWGAYGNGELKKETLRFERFNATLRQFGKKDLDLAKAMGTMYVEISPRQTRLFPFAKEILSELTQMGYHLHMITNGFQEVQYIKLENCGLRDFFTVIVCSEVVGKNKPALAIYKYALEQANCTSASAMMIGDDFIADISGALNAGLQAILFDPYGKSKENYEYTTQSLSDIPLMASQMLRL